MQTMLLKVEGSQQANLGGFHAPVVLRRLSTDPGTAVPLSGSDLCDDLVVLPSAGCCQ